MKSGPAIALVPMALSFVISIIDRILKDDG